MKNRLPNARTGRSGFGEERRPIHAFDRDGLVTSVERKILFRRHAS